MRVTESKQNTPNQLNALQKAGSSHPAFLLYCGQNWGRLRSCSNKKKRCAMVLTVDAVYDGQVFRPVQPITLPTNLRVQIAVTAEEKSVLSFLDVAESLELDGPPDWSVHLDEYLY